MADAELHLRVSTDVESVLRAYREKVPWARRVTVMAVVLALPLVAVGATGLIVHPTAWSAAEFALSLVLGLVPLTLGCLVSSQDPANSVGPTLAGAGLAGLSLTADTYAQAAVARPDVLPVSDVFVSLTQGSWMILFIPFALLMLIYPDGHLLPGLRWRVVAWGFAVVFVAFNLSVSLTEAAYLSPFEDARHVLGTWPPASAISFILLPAFLALLIACVVAMLVRFRSADPATRRQLRWLLLAGTLIPLTLLLCWLSYLLLRSADLVLIGLVAMYLAIPVCATIGLLRSDRYDVDQALVGVVVVAVITAVSLAVFTAVSVTVGLLVGRDSTPVAVIVTALATLGLGPFRRRLERRVSGWLYPDRERAIAMIEDLQTRVHAGTGRPEELEPVLRSALRDDGLQILYPGQTLAEMTDVDGRSARLVGRSVPIMLGGQRIAMITGLQENTPVWPVPRAAILAEMVRLRVELGRALAEVEASRERILTAGYAERRRLERDLHDGAQQRLVTLGMALRVLQRSQPDPSAAMIGALDQAVAEIQTSVAELRQIAHGLRPSSLDDGLAVALVSLTRLVPVPVDLDLDDATLSDEISTTAYYVVSEAITNAVRYAGAARIGLRVEQSDRHVKIIVTDNGCGGAIPRTGAGLAGLSDRVSAHGGTLRLVSPPGQGTLVEAILPCGS